MSDRIRSSAPHPALAVAQYHKHHHPRVGLPDLPDRHGFLDLGDALHHAVISAVADPHAARVERGIGAPVMIIVRARSARSSRVHQTLDTAKSGVVALVAAVVQKPAASRKGSVQTSSPFSLISTLRFH